MKNIFQIGFDSRRCASGWQIDNNQQKLGMVESSLPLQAKKHANPFLIILGKDDDSRFLFRTACEIWDYDVAEAKNCNESLSIISSRIPDLILFDSDIDFEESLKTLSELHSSFMLTDCGVVLISGHAQKAVRRKALSSGADFFLVKPVDFSLLESFLHDYFNDKKISLSFDSEN